MWRKACCQWAERIGEPLEDLDDEHEHVVEVDGVGSRQLALVELVHLGHGLVVERRNSARVLVGADELVLRIRDLRVDAARREALGVAAELLQARLDDAHLVCLVVDRESRPVADPLGLAAKHAPARRVEGEDPDRAGGAAEHALEPLPHLARRLVRERDREDLVRPHAVRPDQVRDTVREHAGLARAGAGDDEERPVDVEHGVALCRIEALEEPVVVGGRRSNRHRSMLPGRPAAPGEAAATPEGLRRRRRRSDVSCPG